MMMVTMLLSIIAFFIVLVILLIRRSDESRGYDPGKVAGDRGERTVKRIIERILQDDDILYNNVTLSFDGKTTELDNLIINRSGVYIIEVKNYIGRLEGTSDDYEWDKYTVSRGGHLYHKTVKNPIKQVKRQIYILSGFLKSSGIYVWVDGYALLIHGNSPVYDEHLVESISQLDRIIHKNRYQLDTESIEKIKVLF